jgi:integrase/recombinase XerD
MVRESYVEQCLSRMRRWMALRGLAPNSIATYARCAHQFLAYVDRPLAAITRRDVEGYLHTLVDAERSPRTRNVQLSAIRCLLRSAVRGDPTAAIPQAKVPRVVRQLLSGSEVARLLAVTTSLKYRAIFMLAYGAGLRVGEITTLQTSDIDSQRMLLRVRAGKTGQRYVMLSPRVLLALRQYWKAYRPPGTELFPGYAKPRPGTRLTRESIHRVLRKAARAAGIHKRVSPHTLRHYSASRTMPSDVEGHSRWVGNRASKQRWDRPITRHSFVGSTDC